jgi:hypothetical protein
LAGPSRQNGQTVLFTEHPSKKIGEPNFDTQKRGVPRRRLPIVTPPPLVAPLSFCWLLRFPAPQPFPLVAPRPGALASFIHYALTFRCTPLVRLVFALIGASPPPSRRDSARCHLSSHPPHLVGLSHCPAPWPIVRMVVMLPLVTPLPPVCLRLSLTRRHSCSLTINFYSCVLLSVSTIDK